ncbi:UNVERIFIED_CONTAM: hypothetical protein NY603_32005, partial [Bacteroidetes bacterium 56_B9]
RTRVDLLSTIGYDADNNLYVSARKVWTYLFPALLAPRLALCPRTEVRHILHDTAHGPTKQLVVFVVHGHHDE